MAAPAARLITPDEYLEAERKADTKHELVNGQIYAIAGASRWHGLLVAHMSGELYARLKGSPCNTVTSDLRVRVPFSEAYLYPDIVIYCGEGKWRDDRFDTLENPLVVVEVLSPTTEQYDRGAKFRHYQLLESMQTYIVVGQEAIQIEVYTRQPDGWLYRSYTSLDQEVEIPSLQISLPLAAIYDRIVVQSVTDSGVGNMPNES